MKSNAIFYLAIQGFALFAAGGQAFDAKLQRYEFAEPHLGTLVRIELFERRLTPELESKLIERMTETLLECLEAPELKEHTWVIVEGHDAHRWGRNAKPWDEGGS